MSLVRPAAVALAAQLAASVAQAFTPYGPPTLFSRPGFASTQLWDVNDAGTLVGASDAIGFVYHAGVFTDVAVPGASSTVVTGLTADGQTLVGAYFADDGAGGAIDRGFLLTAGRFSDFVLAGTWGTSIRHVSDNGRYLTGTWTDASGALNGFVHDRSTGARTDFLATPGGTSIAQGANDAGLVVGSFSRLTTSPGVSESGGFVFDLATGVRTEFLTAGDMLRPRFRDINDSGLIAGLASGQGMVGDLVDWQFFPSTVDGSTAVAYGLNDTGTVVGYYFDSVNLSFQSWIASSVPEPATWALWGLGVVALGRVRRAGARP